MQYLRVLLGLIVWLPPAVLAGCARAEPAAREFEMRGQILAIRSDTEVLVKHDEIRGFMPAMTMPYGVSEPGLLSGKAAGDLVIATITVSDTDAVLTRLEKTGSVPIADSIPEPPAAPRVPLLGVGDRVPEVTLTDASGASWSLAEWRGLAVAITVIYTRCPLPQFCPLMDRRFAELQGLAKTDPAIGPRVRLLSVSFDPDADSPAVLRAHAARLGADPAVWGFATAPRVEVDRFAAAFGVSVIREADGSITHNLRTAVVDPDGRLVAIHQGSDWTVAQLVDDLRRALARR